MADKQIDTRGMTCPLPVLKTSKAIKSLSPGATLEVLATDAASVPDIKAFCDRARHTLVEQSQDGAVYRFLIRKAG